MYDECLKCAKIGNPCDGPNFLAMCTADLIDWCNARRKQFPHMTYDWIAAETGLSKGTVYGFFGGTHADYRLETIRPILKLLVGGEWGDSPCADPGDSERVAYEERIKGLENEIKRRDDTIQHLEGQVKHYADSDKAMQTLIANTNARHTTDKDFLRDQIKSKSRTIRWLTAALVACGLVIIGALIVDRLNPEIGYFWVDKVASLLRGRMS